MRSGVRWAQPISAELATMTKASDIWPTYAAALSLALTTCRNLRDFRDLMAEQKGNAELCKTEAPGIAAQIRAEAVRRMREPNDE